MSGKRVVRESLLAARAGIPAEFRARWDAELIAAAVRLYHRHGFLDCGPFGDYAPDPHSRFMTITLD